MGGNISVGTQLFLRKLSEADFSELATALFSKVSNEDLALIISLKKIPDSKNRSSRDFFESNFELKQTT